MQGEIIVSLCNNDIFQLFQLLCSCCCIINSILEEIHTWVDTQNGDPFGKNSLMKSLMDDEIEVVWFSDRHPNDLIYGIFVNRHTTTVTVVFRGLESAFKRVKDSGITSYPNPIANEEYYGSTTTLRLRSAVAEELLRVRRDVSQTAIEFITEKAKRLMPLEKSCPMADRIISQ